LSLRMSNWGYKIPRIGGEYSKNKVIAVGKNKYIFTNGTTFVSITKSKALTDLPTLLSANNLQLVAIDDEK